MAYIPPPTPKKPMEGRFSRVAKAAWKRDPATGAMVPNEEGREEIRKLQREGRNVAEMFEDNEYAEPVYLGPPAGPIRTNIEPSGANRRAGMITPPRQVREDPYRNPFGGLGELPSEAGRTRKPPSIWRNKRKRTARRRNTRKLTRKQRK